MGLTTEQIKLVQDTVPALSKHGESITTIFYRNMLEENPVLHNYFNIANQANGRQVRALTAVVLLYASKIDRLEEIMSKVEHVCQRHCSLGITPDQYAIVGKYLVAAFAQVLGPAMTPPLAEAWTQAYWQLAETMIEMEARTYQRFDDSWKTWRSFRIQQRLEEADGIHSFHLVPTDGQPLPIYRPGQYMSLRVDVPGTDYKQPRQYSLSEQPNPHCYRISVKRDQGAETQGADAAGQGVATGLNPGLVSNILIDSFKVGDLVEATHPIGDFWLDVNKAPNQPIVLISAGVGVTPNMSILNSVMQHQPSRPISWIQGARHSVPFLNHVRGIATDRDNVRVHIFKTRPHDSDALGFTHDHDGRIDLARVDRDALWLDNPAAEYFVCGPEGFMVDMTNSLKTLGVDRPRIRLELFGTGEVKA